MKGLIFLFLCSAEHVLSQNLPPDFYYKLQGNDKKAYAEKLRADSLKEVGRQKEYKKNHPDTGLFERIFGCSCCMDTLRWYRDKSRIYVLSNSKTELIAFRAGKKKWSVDVRTFFNNPAAKVTCMEFRGPDKKECIRLYVDKRSSSVELNLKTGKILFKKKVP